MNGLEETTPETIAALSRAQFYSSDEEVFCIEPLLSGDKDARVVISLNGAPARVLVDSGASVNVLPMSIYNQIKHPRSKPKPTSISVYPYGSKLLLDIAGVAAIEVQAFGHQRTLDFIVSTSHGVALLGRKSATELDLLRVGPPPPPPNVRPVNTVDQHSVNNNPPQKPGSTISNAALTQSPAAEHPLPEHLKTKNILSRYSKVFEGLGRVKNVQIEIHMKKNAIPVIHSPSRVPVHLREALDKELDLQEALSIIEPAVGPTPSRMVVVPKTTPGQVRITQDWRDVNKNVEREIYPIPTFEEATDEMDGATVWSKLDLYKSFNQLPLHPHPRKYATFSTPRGLRRCTTVVMGFTNASEILQRTMNMVLSGLPGVKWIHDDITVYGKTMCEHNERLIACLDRLKEFNVTLNKEKCVFGASTVNFMAMRLSVKGIQPSTQKVEAVKSFKTPETVSDVKSFLGLVNFLARFVPNLATMAEPLRLLTRSGSLWTWGNEQQESFDKIKESISSETCLAFFSRHRKTELRVDGSPVGVGAILCQVQPDGTSRPVAYASRSLSDVERRYSQLEREALSVKFGCLKFDHYLSGDPGFAVITDHKPLLSLYRPGSRPPPRIERWALRIQHLNFHMRYEPGAQNAADVLSRQPVPPRRAINPSELADTRAINAVISASLPRACTVDEVSSATASDPILQAIIESLASGSWSHPQLAPYYAHRLELTTSDGIVLRGDRILVPASLRKRVLGLAHQGHQGIAKTKSRLRSKVWWPGMSVEADEFVRQCQPCTLANAAPTQPIPPLKPTPLPEAAWLYVGMDFVGPFPTGENLLVLVDYYSRFPEVEIMTKITAEALDPRLRRIFSRYGVPQRIVTDNAQTFCSTHFANLMAEYGIKHRKITPLYPQANGAVERLNRNINKVVKTAIAEGRNWRFVLDDWLLAYRNTPHSVTGQAPAVLMFGRNLNDKLPALHPTSSKATDPTSIREQDTRTKAKSKQYHDNKNTVASPTLKVGDTVAIRNEKKSKLSLPWLKTPFKVTAVKGDSVIVEGENQRLMRHSTAVKKLPESRAPPRDPPDQRDGQEHVDAEYSRKEALRRVRRKPDYYI